MSLAALEYPTRPPAGGKPVLIGGTLLVVIAVVLAGAVVFPPLAILALLPWLVVRGYYVRVVRSSIGVDAPSPPSFARPVALLADGLKAVVIAASYVVPLLVVLALAVVGGGVAEPFSPVRVGLDGLDTPLRSVAGLVALLAILALLGALYVIPTAVANFAYVGQFRAAFDLRRVCTAAFSEDYAVAWVTTVVLQALLVPLAYTLRVLVLGFYMQFLVAVGVRYLYGRGYGAALDVPPRAETTRSEEPTAAGESEPSVATGADGAPAWVEAVDWEPLDDEATDEPQQTAADDERPDER